MVRYLIKNGTKIKLLPPPTPPEESVKCPKCGEFFGTGFKRRVCIEICGHVTCLECVNSRLDLKEGCEECKNRKMLPPEVVQSQGERKRKKQPVLVLLPVLSKDVVDKDEDEFPEIERLSLSALPVLERAVGSPGSVESEEKVQEEVEVEEIEYEDVELEYEDVGLRNEVFDETGEPIPECIDISSDVDEEIPVVDLIDSDDEEESKETVEQNAATEASTEKVLENEILMQNVEIQDTTEESLEIGKKSEQNLEAEAATKKTVEHEEILEKTTEIVLEQLLETMVTQTLETEVEQTLKAVGKQTLQTEVEQTSQDTSLDTESTPAQVKTVQPARVSVIRETASLLQANKLNQEKSPVDTNKHLEIFKETNNETNNDRVNVFANVEYEDISDVDETEGSPDIDDNQIIFEQDPMQGFPQTVEHEEIVVTTEPENTLPSNQMVQCSENEAPVNDTRLGTKRQRRVTYGYLNNEKLPYGSSNFGNQICQYCGAGFRDRSTLGLHLTQEHWNYRPYPCDICNWPFDSARNLENHRLTHTNERPYKCTLCDSAFNRNFTLRKHMDKIHGVVLPKKKRAKKVKTLKTKVSKAQNGVIQYQPPENIHELETETISSISSDDLQFPKKRKYTRRKSKKFKKASSKNFEEEFDWLDYGLKYKSKESHDCVMCQNKFNRRFSLERHMEHSHGVRIRLHPDETPQGEEYCPECQNLFDAKKCTKVAYSQCGHISCVDCVIRAELGCGQCTTETANKEDDAMAEKANDVGQKQLEDEYMAEENNSFDETVADMDVIENLEVAPPKTGEKSYKCKYCVWHIEFSDRKDLGSHMYHAHRDIRPYPCDICKWPFGSLSELERHQLTHSNEKPYKCAMCKTSFNRKSARDRHVEKEHLKWRRI